MANFYEKNQMSDVIWTLKLIMNQLDELKWFFLTQ